ncbi:hypothetical protein C8Q74DRAFT_1230487 [Fomes fomentarius]|nr:hypothetical protein C8Q74DRAFT_1230487 [Fomes fomentarius]
MSNNSQTAQIISEYDSIQVELYVSTTLVCVLAYEYAITLDREVELFWKERPTASAVIFFINRYLALAANTMGLPFSDPTTYKGCAAVNYTEGILVLIQYIPWGIFSALRAYALSTGMFWQSPLAILILLLSLVPTVVNAVDVGHYIITADSDGCTITTNLSDNIEDDFTIICRVCLLASDLLVMAITWNATYRTRRVARALGHNTSLSGILFRDGAIYFIILGIMNVLHLSFSLASFFDLLAAGGNHTSAIILFEEPATAILISRFLMDLQEANKVAIDQHSQVSSFESLKFNRIIGSLGSSLPTPGENSCASSDQGNDGKMETEIQ